MGKTAIFSCFYANLITQGKERGFHVFIVQLRDENHKPMPGVEVFEVGPKIGDNGTVSCKNISCLIYVCMVNKQNRKRVDCD